MKKRRNSKFINFFFRNIDIKHTESNNNLPIMKRSKTNKEILTTNSHEEINKRIINKVHYNYIFKQFNLYCKKDNKKFSQEYLNNLSDLLFSNSRSYSSCKKNNTNNISIHTISNIKKNHLVINTNNNFFEKDSNDTNKEENIYDFGKKIINKEKLKILQLKRKYDFFTLPHSIKDENNSKKIIKMFNSKLKIDLNNKLKVKEKILKRMKIHSLLEKNTNLFAEIKSLKNIGNNNIKKSIKIIERNKYKDKNNENKTNDLNEIEKYIKNDLKIKDCFNSFSVKESQYELDKPKNNIKSNIFLNYMKLKHRNDSSKFIFHSK